MKTSLYEKRVEDAAKFSDAELLEALIEEAEHVGASHGNMSVGTDTFVHENLTVLRAEAEKRWVRKEA